MFGVRYIVLPFIWRYFKFYFLFSAHICVFVHYIDLVLSFPYNYNTVSIASFFTSNEKWIWSPNKCCRSEKHQTDKSLTQINVYCLMFSYRTTCHQISLQNNSKSIFSRISYFSSLLHPYHTTCQISANKFRVRHMYFSAYQL